jgi:hypothetical protein
MLRFFVVINIFRKFALKYINKNLIRYKKSVVNAHKIRDIKIVLL